MSVSTFGVTATSVKGHYFPHSAEFSANSSPTDTTVDEMIDESAADLEGKLAAEGITGSDLTADSGPYNWCAKTLRLMVAICVARASTGQDAAVVKAWEAQLKARLKELADEGGTALGDPTLGAGTAADPAGPTTHLDVYGIDIGDPEADASDAIPALRRSDTL